MKRNGLVFLVLCIAIIAMLASGKYLSRNRQPRASQLVGDVRGRVGT